MLPTFGYRSRAHQGGAHEAMPNHKRNCRSLLFGERHKLRREVTQSVAIERDIISDPKTVNDCKQEQWVLGRFSQVLRLLYILARLSKGSLSIRRRIPFSMHECVRKRDLKLDLLATQGCSTGQRCNLRKGSV